MCRLFYLKQDTIVALVSFNIEVTMSSGKMSSEKPSSEKMPQNISSQENDVCEACGTIVELGSVITEDDTVLVLPFSGPDQASVKVLADKYIKAAKARFVTVEVSVDFQGVIGAVESKVSLQFECTAEKLIFEMGLSAI